MTTPLPPDVEQLLDNYLCDFEHLEIALFLRANSLRDWTAAELAAALPMTEELLVRALSELHSGGLIASRGEGVVQYRYAPRTAELNAALVALSSIYAENRVAVVSRMSVNAINRIKLRTVRAFSDAFVVAKGKKGGNRSRDG